MQMRGAVGAAAGEEARETAVGQEDGEEDEEGAFKSFELVAVLSCVLCIANLKFDSLYSHPLSLHARHLSDLLLVYSIMYDLPVVMLDSKCTYIKGVYNSRHEGKEALFPQVYGASPRIYCSSKLLAFPH